MIYKVYLIDGSSGSGVFKTGDPLLDLGDHTPISAPFSHDGSGEYFWVTEDMPEYIDSECIKLEINLVDLTNEYVEWDDDDFPAPIDGKYYIHFIGEDPSSYFEMGDPVDPTPGPYVPISAPFSHRGAGEYFWVTGDVPHHINSWELSKLEINGVDLTWVYKHHYELPPLAEDGKYYIHFIGEHPWSEFRMGNPVNPNPPDPPPGGPWVPISAPFSYDGTGERWWVTDSIPNYINSWNNVDVEINGINYIGYEHGYKIPWATDGKYYIHFIGYSDYSHFELR